MGEALHSEQKIRDGSRWKKKKIKFYYVCKRIT